MSFKISNYKTHATGTLYINISTRIISVGLSKYYVFLSPTKQILDARIMQTQAIFPFSFDNGAKNKSCAFPSILYRPPLPSPYLTLPVLRYFPYSQMRRFCFDEVQSKITHKAYLFFLSAYTYPANLCNVNYVL